MNRMKSDLGLGVGRALRWVWVVGLGGAGCAAGPTPTLLTLIEPAELAIQDSQLLPDSARAGIRTYLSRVQDSVWVGAGTSDMDLLVGPCAGLTASLNRDALPGPGRKRAVRVDVPGVGYARFEVTNVKDDDVVGSRWTGQTEDGAMSILLVEDGEMVGRINTREGSYNLRPARFGLIHVAPVDRSGSVPEPHLITTAATRTRAVSLVSFVEPSRPSAGRAATC